MTAETTTVLARVRGFYGANPLHLLALLGCFALAGWAALQTLSTPSWPIILVWFVGAVIAHDLVLFPLYALADRSLAAGLRALAPGRNRPRSTLSRIPAVNHVRIPLLGAGLLLLVFFPGILGQGGKTYLDATSQTPQSDLASWLLLSAAMFLISAVIYGVRLARARHDPDPPPASGGEPGVERSGNDPGPVTATPATTTPATTTGATAPPPGVPRNGAARSTHRHDTR